MEHVCIITVRWPTTLQKDLRSLVSRLLQVTGGQCKVRPSWWPHFLAWTKSGQVSSLNGTDQEVSIMVHLQSCPHNWTVKGETSGRVLFQYLFCCVFCMHRMLLWITTPNVCGYASTSPWHFVCALCNWNVYGPPPGNKFTQVHRFY